MEIRVKGDSVEITGYVNSIERKSKPLWSRIGQFVERIRKGAFAKALKRNDNVRILLNHDPNRDLGGTKDGNLELEEDNIGLRARATITDPEVVEKAKRGDLVGWSFGFYDRDVELRTDEDGYPLRDVNDLDLEEVSILDKTKTPAYDGTLVMVRADDSSIFYGETFIDDITLTLRDLREVKEETPKDDVAEQPKEADEQINYEEWDAFLKELRA